MTFFDFHWRHTISYTCRIISLSLFEFLFRLHKYPHILSIHVVNQLYYEHYMYPDIIECANVTHFVKHVCHLFWVPKP